MTPLCLQRLERRDNPAGTVTATLRGSTWMIVGDGEANDITINPGPQAGSFLLAGTGTTVAGDTSPAGVVNVVVKLGGGSDALTVNDTGVPAVLQGKLTVDGGDGANDVLLEDLTIGKDLVVRNGVGEDELTALSVTVLGKVSVRTGDGGSVIALGATPGVNYVNKGVSVVNGAGQDFVIQTDLNIGGDLMVDQGLPDPETGLAGLVRVISSDNFFSRSTIAGDYTVRYRGGASAAADLFDAEVAGDVCFDFGGAATATATFDSFSPSRLPPVVRGSLTVRGAEKLVADFGVGQLEDGLVVEGALMVDAVRATLSFRNVFVGGKTMLRSGDGADLLTIDDSVFHGLAIATGGGADRIEFERSLRDVGSQVFGKALIDLGTGDDTLLLGAVGDAERRVESFGRLTLQGGDGVDTLAADNLLAPFAEPVVLGF